MSIGLLIADDEAMERDALELMAKRSGLDLVCYKARNGSEATDITAKVSIGIAILDIKMPVMGGMEAARIIREISPGTVIVFLTAWGTFDYAQEAIRIGAEDYLVKPCDNDTFVALLKHCLEKLEKQKKPSEDVNLMLNLFTRQFFTALKYGKLPDESVKSFLKLKGITINRGLAMIASGNDADRILSVWQSSVKLKDIPICYYKAPDRLIMLAFSPDLERIKPILSEKLKGLPVGIGTPFMDTGDISSSVHGASVAVSRAIRKGAGIVSYSPEFEDSEDTAPPREAVGAIVSCVNARMMNEALSLGHEAIDRIVSVYGDGEKASSVLYGFLLVLSHEIFNLVPNLQMPALQAGPMGEMDTYLNDLIEASCQALVSDSKDKYGRAFELVRKYLEENYCREISSGEVAEKFNISPGYFPRLFKERFKVSFVEYITDLRMTRAMELLRSGRTVKDTAYLTGFSDSNYFSRVFKQKYHVAPKEIKSVF